LKNADGENTIQYYLQEALTGILILEKDAKKYKRII
jgi:hypothetical protein